MDTRTLTTSRVWAGELSLAFLFRLVELAGWHQLQAGRRGPTLRIRFWAGNTCGIINMEAEAY